jgi:hypothetical protein
MNWDLEQLRLMTVERRREAEESRLARAAQEDRTTVEPTNSDDHGS